MLILWSSLQIAKELFGNDVKLSKEQRTVHEYTLTLEESAPVDESFHYAAPHAISRIVKKINDSTGYGLKKQKCLDINKLVCED